MSLQSKHFDRRVAELPTLDHNTMALSKGISVTKEIVVGHLCVNGGVFTLMGATALGCHAFDLLSLPIAAFIGVIVAWPWWSLAVPKWRRWALEQGADAKQLQKMGVRTGLLWPKGSVFEKTEIPPKRW